LPSLLYTLILWLIFYYEIHFKKDLSFLGVLPRHLNGLPGIILMPFLHANSSHLISNSIPVLVLGTLLFYFYRNLALKISFISVLISGILVWLLANWSETPAYHIGASGLIYAWAAFLVFSGWFRKNKALFGISSLVVFLYGTLVWGVLPEDIQKVLRIADVQNSISWEGHLFGFISGAFLAFFYRKVGETKPVYSWEINNDEDVDESNPYWLVNDDDNSATEKNEKISSDPLKIHYTFIPENPDKTE
jgi:membrane associated rhomboid family serine protease